MIGISNNKLIVGIVAVAVVSLASNSFFYLSFPDDDDRSVYTNQSVNQLQKYVGLQKDFNLVAAKKIWGSRKISAQSIGGAENGSWELLGIFNEAEQYALIWRSDQEQIVRLLVGDEIVSGLILSEIGSNGIRYQDSTSEVVVPLYSTTKKSD